MVIQGVDAFVASVGKDAADFVSNYRLALLRVLLTVRHAVTGKTWHFRVATRTFLYTGTPAGTPHAQVLDFLSQMFTAAPSAFTLSFCFNSYSNTMTAAAIVFE